MKTPKISKVGTIIPVKGYKRRVGAIAKRTKKAARPRSRQAKLFR